MSEEIVTYGTNWDAAKMNNWLKETVKEIRNVIELEADQSNPLELADKLNRLAVMTSTCAMAQGVTRKLLLLKQKDLMTRLPELSASLQKAWLDGEMFEEHGMQTYVDRLSAGVSNSIEAVRSILSFTKQEMQNSKFQDG